MSKALDVLKATWKEFNDDKIPTYAAAISYATVFALPPLMMLMLTIVGMFVDPADFRGRIVAEITKMVGPDSAKLLGDVILQANKPGAGIMAVAGIVLLVVGATGAFIALQDALNTAWNVKPNPKGGIKALLFKRILSFGMILLVGFMLLISFVVAALVTAFGGMLDNYVGGAGVVVVQILQIVVGFVVTWGLFAMIFKVLPDAKIEWRDIWLGSFVTALLFNLGRIGIGFYLGHSRSASAFGAAAALAVLLIWVYYAALILLVGAEFTQVWLEQHGRKIKPEHGAVVRENGP
ncbi:MAG TPA: YihY/virulence factor BrkB family protein [Longimicrobiales bacterium]|nr:YihY/virulence factor BrkB family protein [Longimicrobiales bacterium]